MRGGVDLLDRLELDVPVFQAGMGGGIAGAELAGAVSRAGGLGTVGIQSAERFGRQLRRARDLAGGRGVSANLLLPFTRREHVTACIEARVAAVSLFFGFDRDAVRALHDAGIAVLHQVGTVEQARRAIADGADALIAQGREAGGHLLAEAPLRETLPRVLEVAGETPVLAAGGIHDAAGTQAALDAGAAGAWCGTRFLLTDESGAHPLYKQRALGAPRTIETKLFGLGWPDDHRVLPNAATERWASGGVVAKAAALATAASRPLGRLLPIDGAGGVARQRPGIPLFGPGPPLAGMPDELVEATALYAGECARAIDRVVPAGEAVRLLTPARP